MSEPVKIAEDLQEWYEYLRRGIGYNERGPIAELIERVSAAEAALVLVKAELARLKAPVSDGELIWAADRTERFSDRFNRIIAARSTAPDGAQEAEGARDE